MTRTINFDNFRAEQKNEPVNVIIGGETYALPSSLPASMAVDMMRMQATFQDENEEVPTDAMDTFGRSLFGPTVWTELLMKHRITVDEISPLMEMVFDAYTDEPPKGETEASSPPTSETPESSSTSSRRGRGSKPTS